MILDTKINKEMKKVWIILFKSFALLMRLVLA